jgi:adenylylsulfate kinase-like enzyme
MFGQVIWLFGLSGSGKTTLGGRLAKEYGFLFLDSDLVRQVLGAPQDFTVEGRLAYQKRLRRHIINMQWQNNNSFVVASIAPMQVMRNENRRTLSNYFEVYLSCNILELMRRDPKGLYEKACRGEISDFTGITSPFEVPVNNGDQNSFPDLIIETDKLSIEESYHLLRQEIAGRR